MASRSTILPRAVFTVSNGSVVIHFSNKRHAAGSECSRGRSEFKGFTAIGNGYVIAFVQNVCPAAGMVSLGRCRIEFYSFVTGNRSRKCKGIGGADVIPLVVSGAVFLVIVEGLAFIICDSLPEVWRALSSLLT